MRKKLSLFFIFVIFSSAIFSYENPVTEYVLENGLELFVCEDFSAALVNVEYTVRAGFSSQTPETAGFFPLYTKLFKYSAGTEKKFLKELTSECNADSSRYRIKCPAKDLDAMLSALSNAAFKPMFFDEDLENEFELLKKEVTDNAFSLEGFINSSIDARVFSESPWKHDSGIYPGLFAKTNLSLARKILFGIREKYYIPKNSAIFISGPVKKEIILKKIEQYFGSERSREINSTERKENDSVKNTKRLFVLSDSELSPDMTQIVMQYTTLSMEQCDFAAAIMEQNDSVLKENLLKSPELKIRSAEYINAAATHKNNSSRLVIQSLLENLKTPVYESSVKFIESVKNSVLEISDSDLFSTAKILKASFEKTFDNCPALMDALSQFWAIENYANKKNDGQVELFESFCSREKNINSIERDVLVDSLAREEPFVFVLVNSKVLEKNKKNFEKNGFEIVTVKNGSWYTQKLYENIQNKISEEKTECESLEKSFGEDFFVSENKNSFKTYRLNNGIPVFLKEKKSSRVCLSVVIKGGELTEQKSEYGLEEVLVNCLSYNLEKRLYEKYLENKISMMPDVKSETSLLSSSISAECFSEEINEVLEAFSDSLIFNDIIPAVADSIVMQKKSDQIVKTSSPVFQLYSAGISSLIKNKNIQNVYSTNKDILKSISFDRIMQNYPALLNGKRYSVIISGNVKDFSDETPLKDVLEKTFGILAVKDFPLETKIEIAEPKNNVKKIKIVHQFFTDVSREKAGPRPQVLIPTTEFLDPVQFWIKNNSDDDNYLFNCVLYQAADFLEKECALVEQKQPMLVKVSPASKEIPFGVITVLNVKSLDKISELFEKAVIDTKEKIISDDIEEMKSLWIARTFSGIEENYETNSIIKKYIEFNPEDFSFYLDEYDSLMKITSPFLMPFVELFQNENIFRVISNDTKK